MALTEDSRDPIIDLIKSIGILLVVLGHINSPFGKIIYSFHMPLFFIISGAFIIGQNSLRQLHKDIVKLIVPTLVFFVIGYFVTFTKNLYLEREIENFYIAFQNLFYWTDSKLIKNYGFVLWFLPVLFWGKLITNSLIFKYSRYNNLIILSVIIILILIKKYFSIFIPLGIDIAIFVVPFLLLGYLTYGNRYTILNYKFYILFISLFILYFLIEIYGIQWVDIGAREYDNYMVSILFAYLIFLILYLVCNVIFIINKIFRPLLFFGENTLLILILHPYTNNIADKLTSIVNNEYRWLFTFLVSIILCLIFYSFYKNILQLSKGIKLSA